MYKVVFLPLTLFLLCSCSENEGDTEKKLQDDIVKAKKKYDELDEYQKAVRDDIQNQLISIGCSTNRLIKLKDLENTLFKNIITELVRRVEIFHVKPEKEFVLIRNNIAHNYKYKSNLSIHLTDLTYDDNKVYSQAKKDEKITYKSKIDDSIGTYNGDKANLKLSWEFKDASFSFKSDNQVNAEYKNRVCSKLYDRPIPNSEQAKDLESKAFEEEIANAIKRINSFPERIKIAEEVASEATVYESILTKRLLEYQVDKSTPSVAEADIKKFEVFVDEADKKVEGLAKLSETQNQGDIEFIREIFK